jgi:TPR repeat protein
LQDKIGSFKRPSARPAREQAKRVQLNESQNESQEIERPVEEDLCLEGDRYFHGHGVIQDYEKAKKFYEDALHLGSGRACSCLAKMYEEGIGVEKDLIKAFGLYKEGDRLEDPACRFALGKYFENNLVPEDEKSRGIEDAVSYYEYAADKGYAEAMTKLGYMHEHRIYYEKDVSKALDYYKKAKKQNDPLAINYLGLYYYRMAQRSEKDLKEKYYEQAVNLFKESRRLGCTEASNNLGMCYEQGTGVERDMKEALECYMEAATQGYSQGMFNVGYLHLCRAKTSKLNEDYEKAAHWFRVAIVKDPSLRDAYFYLGVLFEKGLGVDCDYHNAFGYYKKATTLEHPKAATKCGNLLISPYGLIKPDKAEALKFYKRGSELGDAEAYLRMAEIYEEGDEDIHKNEKLAIQYYERARELGLAEGSVNLSRMYETGTGVRKDTNRAKELLIEGANNGSYIARNKLISTGVLPSIRVNEERDEGSSVLGPYRTGMYFPKRSPFAGPESKRSAFGTLLDSKKPSQFNSPTGVQYERQNE